MTEISEGMHAIIKLAAKEAAEQAIEKAKQEWREDITDHAFECQATKFMQAKTFVVAIIGGAIATLINWLVGKK